MQARITELSEMDDLRRLAELFANIWGRPHELPVDVSTLRALSHSGNYVAGAWLEDRLIGGLIGWFGGEPPDHLHLHSHILGVVQDEEARGVGFALKQHQRDWCMARGVMAIEWTFDPLVRRNAYFNLAKLGADVAEYIVNFYGVMDDGINAGHESDRFLVRWHLDSQKAVAAAAGRPFEPDVRPDHVLVALPEDIVAIRRDDPEIARQWRHRLRDAVRGHRVAGITRKFEYVLEPL